MKWYHSLFPSSYRVCSGRFNPTKVNLFLFTSLIHFVFVRWGCWLKRSLHSLWFLTVWRLRRRWSVYITFTPAWIPMRSSESRTRLSNPHYSSHLMLAGFVLEYLFEYEEFNIISCYSVCLYDRALNEMWKCQNMLRGLVRELLDLHKLPTVRKLFPGLLKWH